MRDGKISGLEKIARLVLSLVLPLAFYLVCFFVAVSDLIWLIAATFAAAILFAVPCFANLFRIKSGVFSSVKPFIAADFFYTLLPSAAVSFLLALMFYLFAKSFDGVFMLSLLLVLLFTVISLCFWQLYVIASLLAKRRSRK